MLKNFSPKNHTFILVICILILNIRNTSFGYTIYDNEEIIKNAMILNTVQRKNFKNINTDKKNFSKYEKQKYKTILKLRNREIKNKDKIKNYYKSNPKLEFFGNLTNCSYKSK